MYLPGRNRRVALLALLLAIPTLLAAWLLVFDPRGDLLPSAPSPATVAIYDRHGLLLYEALDPQQGKAAFVPLGELPPRLLQATVATEDASFYSNPGVDPFAILRAFLQNWRSEGVASGGSTITQQLARNLWMTPEERSERSLVRKLREAALALRLAARCGKDEILELYLNSAPYGHQAIGVEAAARVYFGKSARDLDLAESALLAGLPQAPSDLDPLLDLSAARARQGTVLALMQRQRYVTEEEARAAADEDLALADTPFPIRAPHFVAYVRQLLESHDLDPNRVGRLNVHTTLDLGLQEVAEATVRRHVASLADKGVSNGALVALDPRSGEILAMVGSANYFDEAIDGEVNVALAQRQPGSALKPFLYGLALERGFTAATVLYDVPTSFLTADGKGYAPENYDQVWHGPVSLREALANSYNLPAVSLLQQVGVGAFLDGATRAGLSSLGDKGTAGLSLVLGSGEVRLLDMASAYGSLANAGVGLGPVAILRVVDTGGHDLLRKARPPARRSFSPQVAYLLTSILSDDEARGAAFGRGSALKLSRPAAAKTGTTTDWRDNWTVGYTPELVTGVWVGNADNQPMRGVSGISGAAPIWHDFMEEALKGRPAAQFQEPPGLVRREVCPESGQLPSPWCPSRRTELFLDGTAPTSTCGWHRSLPIDRSTGMLAGPNCPPELVDHQLFHLVPLELQSWARGRGIPEPPTVECTLHGGSNVTTPAATTLRLTSPTNEAVLRISPEIPLSSQQLEIAAVAAGLGQGVRMQLLVDGIVLASFDASSCRASWTLSPGTHLFEARALDASGNLLASDSVSILVEDGRSAR